MATLETEESGAVVKRWPLWRGQNKSQCMDFLSAGTKKSGQRRVMAVSAGSTVSIGKRLLKISTFYGIKSVCRSHVLQKILIKFLTLISTHS